MQTSQLITTMNVAVLRRAYWLLTLLQVVNLLWALMIQSQHLWKLPANLALKQLYR